VGETRKNIGSFRTGIKSETSKRNMIQLIKIGLEENPPSLMLQDQAKKRGKKKQSTAKIYLIVS